MTGWVSINYATNLLEENMLLSPLQSVNIASVSWYHFLLIQAANSARLADW